MRRSLALAALGVILAGAAARAHVAPAITDNNRYLKLTPLGDRVRLAYTVFYGEVPGGALRQAIDRNHDGAIDDAESQAFGGALADAVAGAVVVVIDGAPQRVAWSQVVVGLGTPQVTAGAFSVDLVAWLCLPTAGGAHTVVLRDHYAIDRPGETEVAVEDSPGVTIAGTRLGAARDGSHDYKLVGPSGVLDSAGLELRFSVADHAPIARDGLCADGSAGAGWSPGVWIAGAAAAVLAGAARFIKRRKAR